MMTQAAPSLIPEAFPAVTVPSFLKEGLRPARLSRFVFGRINHPLLLSRRILFLRLKTATGVISLAKRPSACALAAFC